MFAKSGATEEWTVAKLPAALSAYLHDRGEQKVIGIDGLSKPVEVHFIGQSGADEWLFRLVDPERPTETAVLKQAFPLTDRETEVLLWISKGKTNREIGMILSTSPRTINKHLEQVFKKLGVENRTTAATLALQQLNRQDVQND